jgi:hypothetical protein
MGVLELMGRGGNVTENPTLLGLILLFFLQTFLPKTALMRLHRARQ